MDDSVSIFMVLIRQLGRSEVANLFKHIPTLIKNIGEIRNGVEQHSVIHPEFQLFHTVIFAESCLASRLVFAVAPVMERSQPGSERPTEGICRGFRQLFRHI